MAKKKKEVELKEVSRTEINGAIIIKYEDGSVKIIPAPITLTAEEAEDLFGSESEEEEEEEEDEEEEDEEDEEEEDEEEEEEEEEAPPKGMVKVKCVACGGTGKNSKGGVCSPCKGKGYKLVPSKKSVIEDDDDEEEETATPKKSKGKENKCPYKHTFGEDTDSFDDCNHCKVWQACYDANDA